MTSHAAERLLAVRSAFTRDTVHATDMNASASECGGTVPDAADRMIAETGPDSSNKKIPMRRSEDWSPPPTAHHMKTRLTDPVAASPLRHLSKAALVCPTCGGLWRLSDT